MQPNATLRKAHFVWDTGTRVEVLHYWNSPDRATVLLPATATKAEGCWVLPTQHLQFDPGIVLDTVTVDTKLQKE